MKLILIRHGETDWLKARRYQGTTDVSLNQKGKYQAGKLAGALKNEKPAVIYTSKLVRTIQTAEPLARSFKQKTISDSRLNELNFGVWEGFSYSEVEHHYQASVKQYYSPRLTSKPKGGEDFQSLYVRTSSFLNDLKKKYKDSAKPCVIVGHGGPIRMFLIVLFELPIKIFWNIRVDPASISIVEIKKNRNELMLLNSQSHLNQLK